MTQFRSSSIFVIVVAVAMRASAGSPEECTAADVSEQTHVASALLQTKRNHLGAQVISGSEQDLMQGYRGAPGCLPVDVQAKRQTLALVAKDSRIRIHSGDEHTAPLDATGFKEITSLCCPQKMETFFTRLLESTGHSVCSKPHIQGLMHWFHCVPDMDFQYVLDVIANGNPCKYWAPTGTTCPVLSAKCQGKWCSAAPAAPAATTAAATTAAATTVAPAATTEAATTAADTTAATTLAATTAAPAPGTTAAVSAGEKVLPIDNAAGFSVGQDVTIGAGTPTAEVNTIAGFGSLILKYPLKFDHDAGTLVSAAATTTAAATTAATTAAATTVAPATTAAATTAAATTAATTEAATTAAATTAAATTAAATTGAAPGATTAAATTAAATTAAATMSPMPTTGGPPALLQTKRHHSDTQVDQVIERDLMKGYHGAPGCLSVDAQAQRQALALVVKDSRIRTLSGDDHDEHTAPLDATGFKEITSLCCPYKMEIFFTRLLESTGHSVCSTPHIQGLMHWFHCVPDMDFQYVLDVIANGNPCKYWAPTGTTCPVLSAQCQGKWCSAAPAAPAAPAVPAPGATTVSPAATTAAATTAAPAAPAATTAAPAVPSTAPVAAGDKVVPMDNTAGFSIGQDVTIGAGTPTAEDNTIAGFGSLILKYPLKYEHAAGTLISCHHKMGDPAATTAAPATTAAATTAAPASTTAAAAATTAAATTAAATTAAATTAAATTAAATTAASAATTAAATTGLPPTGGPPR